MRATLVMHFVPFTAVHATQLAVLGARCMGSMARLMKRIPKSTLRDGADLHHHQAAIQSIGPSYSMASLI
jgi:hypothetical protein